MVTSNGNIYILKKNSSRSQLAMRLLKHVLMTNTCKPVKQRRGYLINEWNIYLYLWHKIKDVKKLWLWQQ